MCGHLLDCRPPAVRFVDELECVEQEGCLQPDVTAETDKEPAVRGGGGGRLPGDDLTTR